MSGAGDPFPIGDWESFRAARDRFFAKARPEAMDEPPPSICPDAPLAEWSGIDESRRGDHGRSDGE